MLRENAQFFNKMSQLFDIILICIAFCAVIVFFEYELIIGSVIPIDYFINFVLYILFWLISSDLNRVYESRRLMSSPRELMNLAKAHLLTLTLCLIALRLLDPELIKNYFVLYFAAASAALTCVIHIIVRLLLETIRKKGRNVQYCLIIGDGLAAKIFLDKVRNNPQLGYKVIGYVAPKRNELDTPYLGDYSQIETILKENIVDMVTVTVPQKNEGVTECINLVEAEGKNSVLLIDEMVQKASITEYRAVEFGDLSLFEINPIHHARWQEILKSVFDVIITTTALIIISPLMLIIAIAIKTTSEGPVFFVQKRVGLNGRIFNMYKFRSMVQDAEKLKENLASLNEMSGPVFKIKNDPRVTPIGRFLRKTSMDELPQFINVLKRDMSLVGPRPPLPSEVDMYNPKHRKRLSVRPGITCIWQISGRNNIDFDHWMDMDSDYVDHWSFWLDMEILAKTIPVVILRKGAS